MTTRTQGTVDRLDLPDVLAADRRDGPKVTLYLPTPETGPQASLAASTFKAQVKDATARLIEAGLSPADADSVLAPASDLVDDTTWWREQSRSLVVFAAPGYHRAFRIPVEVPASVTVGSIFHLLPLARLLDSKGRCYILAVSKNQVRLFDATRNTIDELPLGAVPARFDEVVEEIPEKQLQAHTTGSGDVGYHGHGSANDTDRMLTEEFLRAVGDGIGSELGTARSQPLVLASVAEYLPVFRDACPYPVIHPAVIAGNHDHTLPDQLRSDAWSLLEDGTADREESEREQALSQAHNGRGSFDVAEIARAAAEGRVDTLYLPADESLLVSPGALDLVDRALADTVRSGGTVRLPLAWPADQEALATFRH